MRTSTFALFIGMAYVSAGILGLVPAALMPPPNDAPPVRFDVLYGWLLGLFPVNVLHVPAALMPPPDDAPPVRFDVLYGWLLGLFPVNVLHSAVHFAQGAWGIVAWRTDHSGRGMGSPKTYSRALAIFNGALAVIGLVPALYTLFGFMPIHGHDALLHAATAAIAGYFGWRTEVSVERRSEADDRRQEARRVEQERRLGHSDRRVPGSEV